MAVFNPGLQEREPNNFTSYSRETRGNPALGILLEDVGTTTSAIVQEKDRQNLKEIESIARGDSEEIQSLFGVDAGTVTSATPFEVQRGEEYIQRLNQAYQAGTIRESHYYGMLNNVVRGLRSKFPGYESEIDNIIQGITGVIPANAMVTQLRQEAEQDAAQASAEADRWESFENGNMAAIETMFPGYFQTDPSERPNQAEVRAGVAAYEYDQTSILNEQARLALLSSQNALDDRDITNYAQNTATIIGTRVVNQLGSNLLDTITQMMTGEASIGPDELEQVSAMGTNLILQAETQIREALMQPIDPEHPEEGSPWSRMSQTDRDAAIQAGTAQIRSMVDAIGSQDWNLAAANAIWNTAAQDRDTRYLLENSPIIRDAQAARAILGDAGFNYWLQNNPNAFNELNTALGVDNMLGLDIDPDGASVNSDLEDMANDPNIDDNLPAAVIQSHVDRIINPESSPEQRANSIQYLFENEDGIDLSLVPSDQRFSLFSDLTNPEVTQAVYQLSQGDPELWAEYREWASRNFQSLTFVAANNFRQANANFDNSLFTIDFNTTTGQLVAVPNENAIDINQPGLTHQEEMEYWNKYYQQQASIDDLRQINLGLLSMKSIADAEGGDISYIIDALAQQLGTVIEPTTTSVLQGIMSPEETNNVLDGGNPNTGVVDENKKNSSGNKAFDPGGSFSPVEGSLVQYANQSAVRNQPVTPQLDSILTQAAQIAGLDGVRVFSGGQPSAEEGGARVGSNRHDHGNAADINLIYQGRLLDFNNPEDLVIIQRFIQAARSLGATGFGAGVDYMGSRALHVGFGTPGVWGANGSSANAPSWLVQAFNG